MTPAELLEELRAGRLRPAYLLAGSEPLLREDAWNAIAAAAFGERPREFDLDRLDGVSTTPADLADALRSLPVLAERRVVLLRQPEARAGAATELLEAVARCVAELRERSDVLLVVSAERIDRRARWVRAFAEPAVLVGCDAPTRERELVAFATAEAKRQGVRFGPGAAEALVERVGAQLLLLRQEIAKASLYAGVGEVVRREHVAATASDVADEPVWDLTDAIGAGRAAEAVVLLHRMLGAGVAPPLLLGSLASHFRKLARVRAGGQVSLHPFALRKLEDQARRQPLVRLRQCLQAIHKADEALKGAGVLPPDLVLERLVLGLAY